MDLKQLDILVAIAEHGSFSAAARARHTVQSNASAHIARLERELEAVLVDRDAGGLTEEGEIVLFRARRIQRELDAVRADVAALHDEIVGSVRIGVIGTVGRWLVPRLLERVADRHPRITIVVVDATTTSLLPQLEAATLDLAVLNLPVVSPPIVTEALFDEERVVILPADHALAERDRVALADLAGYPMVLEPPGTAFRDELDAAAAAIGVEFTTRADVDGMSTVAALAFDGFAPAVVPATAVLAGSSGTWTVRPLDGVSARTVGLARRRNERLAAPSRTVASTLREVLTDIAEAHPGIHLTPA